MMLLARTSIPKRILPLLNRRLYSTPASLAPLTRSPQDPNISLLTLDRPQSYNALSLKLLEDLSSALETVRYDGSTRVLVLNSSSPGKAFCSGADLKERKGMTAGQVDRFLRDLRGMLGMLEDLPFPTIAAIDGVALGGGLELALACDLRVAGPGATKIGLPEVKLAIIPGAGGTQRLTRLLGPAKAKSLIFTGRTMDAKEAYEFGLVDYLAGPSDSATGKALSVAQNIAPHAPLAIKQAKTAIAGATEVDLDTGLDLERACYEALLGTEDRQEALKAFAEKRAPVFKGR